MVYWEVRIAKTIKTPNQPPLYVELRRDSTLKSANINWKPKMKHPPQLNSITQGLKLATIDPA